MGNIKQSPPKTDADAEEIFKHAAYFEYATRLLATHNIGWMEGMSRLSRRAVTMTDNARIVELSSHEDFPPCMKPQIVTSCLSIELYLKCLSTLEKGSYLYVHMIGQLFNEISPTRQIRIKELFEEGFNRNPQTALFRQRVTDPKELEFEHLLKQADNAFVQWRYYFDGLSADSTLGNSSLRKAVRRTILEIKPEWKPFLGFLDRLRITLTH